MRISIVVWGLEGGAFANLSTSLALGFQDLGIEVDLVSVHPVSEHARRARPGLSITSLGCPKTSLAVAHLAGYLRNRRPTAVISLSSIINFLAIAARKIAGVDTCLIITEHNTMSQELPIDHKWSIKMRSIPILARILYPLADGIVAPTWDIFNDTTFRRAYQWQHQPHRVIPNPLTWGAWRNASFGAEFTSTTPHPWLVSDQARPLIVSIGRLVHQKGFDTLIRAVKLLHEQGVHAHVIILGEGPLRQELENLTQQLSLSPFVTLPGFVQNPRPYLERCDAFVLASRFEGFGLVLTEAMALGKPVVATSAPGGPRTIIQDGKNGLLVPVDGEAQLAEAMARVLSDAQLARTLGLNARDSIRMYEPSVIAAQYRDFISEILGSKHMTPPPKHSENRKGQQCFH